MITRRVFISGFVSCRSWHKDDRSGRRCCWRTGWTDGADYHHSGTFVALLCLYVYMCICVCVCVCSHLVYELISHCVDFISLAYSSMFHGLE